MLSDELRSDLNTALNESTVAAIHLDIDTATVTVLLHVLALPDDGPLDPDPRRALILSGVSDFRILLRPDRAGHRDYGPVIPLPDLDALTKIFVSLTINQPMYGWKFLDDPDLIADWPVAISLDLQPRQQPAAHSFYWFTECAREADNLCLEGVAQFDTLHIARADGIPIAIGDFAADGRRWWKALFTNDPRAARFSDRCI